MDLIFATANQNKLIEINKIIPNNVNIISFEDLKFDEEVPENENTIKENAIFKAKYPYMIQCINPLKIIQPQVNSTL